MRKLCPIFSIVIAIFVVVAVVPERAGASPTPQAAAGAGVAQSAPATAGTVPPRAHRSKTFTLRRAAVKPKPEQPDEPVLMPPTWYFDAPEIPKEIVGQTSTPFPLIVTNSSTTATVHVTSVTADNTEFVLGGDCTVAGGIAPGGTCTLQITYNPASACEDSVVDITFADDDPGGDLVLTLASTGASAGGIVTDDLRDTKLSATQLAQSLVGPGVTISNVTYTGSLWSAGTFTGGSDILGFGTGIILSNGAVSNVIGPNCSTGITQSNATPGDTDLSNLIGQVTNDAAVLEFDFVPTSPTISFQYVFASDEYQDFVFDFNDVFAFFLGPEGSSRDIALIPGTNTIVSINNVNNGSTDSANLTIPPVNPQFYVNNDFQFPAVAPFNTEMDGMTVVLTATAQVTPGQKNHIKLAVADAIDTAFDSNVFIKAGSLTSSSVSFAPSSLAFGNVSAGTTAAAQTVTLTNVGTVPLGSLAISTSSAEFAETNTCGTSLAAGASCAVSVTFTPQAAGLVQANLSISDNAPDSPQVLSISGTGISGPFVSFAPFSLTFGPQAPGTMSPAQTITITNTGTSGLTIGSITAAGDDFAAGNDCTESVIPPKGTCTITVTWTPAEDVTTETGTITITDNAQNQGTQTIGLTAGVTATVGIAPSSLSFGNQAVNTTSAAQTITLTNTGTAILTVPSVVVSSSFGETNTCTANPVAPGGTCTISVTFTPTAATTFNGTVTITDTATSSPQMVTLSGTGTAAGNVALTINEAGTGTGTVTSTPAGINCQPTCSANFASGTQVVLTATPATGSTFTGWSGANSCEGTGTCTFTITAATTVTATFGGGTTNFALTVNEAGTGTGTVTSAPAGINCKPTCSANFVSGTQVTLTAAAATGSTFTGWSAPCEGTGTCTVTITAATTVTATFNGPTGVIVTVPSGGSTMATTTPGGTAFFGLLITGGPGVTGTVQLTCASSSPLITCTVIPSTVVLNGGTTEVAFGIQTFCQGSTVATGSVPGGFGGGIGMLLAALMFGGIGWTFRRDRRVGLTFAMLMLVMVSAACGGLPKSANGATPAGTYFISLSTTLNGQTQTLQNFLTLVVKP